jgi:hypothetical protein
MDNTISKKTLLLFTATFFMSASMNLLAGNHTSENLHILAIEISEPAGYLRLYVKRRIEIRAEAFDFNPGNCTRLKNGVNLNDRESGPLELFDLELSTPNRSAVEQRQLINQIFSAFLTSSELRFIVTDEACSSGAGRLVMGTNIN